MKSMKKTIAFIITLAMMLTMMVIPAAAAESVTITDSGGIAAFLEAIANPNVSVITLNTTANNHIVLPYTVVIDRELTIRGAASLTRSILLDPELPANTRHFSVTSDGNLTLGAWVTVTSGANWVDGAWVLHNKGGIEVLGGTLTTATGAIMHVGTTQGGGAIFADGGIVTVHGSIQHAWAQEGNGGAILAVNGSTVTVDAGTNLINFNHAPNGIGGAFAVDASSSLTFISAGNMASNSCKYGSRGGITGWNRPEPSVCYDCREYPCVCIDDPCAAGNYTPGDKIVVLEPTYTEEGRWEIRCVYCDELIEYGVIQKKLPDNNFTGTIPAQLNALLAQGSVELSTPGNYGIAQNTELIIPADSTLVVTSVLNVRRNAELIINGTLIVAEGGRINNDGHPTAGGGTITIAEGGELINYGYIESVSKSTIINEGTITNNGTTGNLGRFEIRAETIFISEDDAIGGTRALNIHNRAIRTLEP